MWGELQQDITGRLTQRYKLDNLTSLFTQLADFNVSFDFFSSPLGRSSVPQ
jgi:hypothetical protein